jgi:hypothetical protein
MPGVYLFTCGYFNTRFSLFTCAFDLVKTDEVYLQAFGSSASGYQNAPPGMPFAPSVASGVDKTGQLAVQKFPGRIDIIVSPITTQSVVSSPLILLREPAVGLDLVQRAAVALMREESFLARIALGAEFAHTSDSLSDANRALLDVLPFAVPLTDQTDFILQFTARSNSSSTEGVKINNVMRWAVAEMQQISIPAYNTGATQQLTAASFFYASQFVADVNTVPGGPPITGSHVGPILGELRKKVDQARRGQWEGEQWNI